MQFYLALAALATTAFAAPRPQTAVPPLENALNGTGIGSMPTNASLSAYPNIFSCAGKPYYQQNYTCYEQQYLCPVVNNRRTLACGDACYDPMNYGCDNGNLVQVANGSFLNGTMANTTAESGDYRRRARFARS